ncbi:general transcription factor 3C polypeptide 3 [Anoplophora glabripennis]|uniref:general transcription factor 3C polypeptide 3 n=1 Tax=Anoplophora glabripennis TaxID=217634 RepID=UPI0008744BDB|nr:general transcription factor 3C polypeptide 3 [Anoplophora glabripennis]
MDIKVTINDVQMELEVESYESPSISKATVNDESDDKSDESEDEDSEQKGKKTFRKDPSKLSPHLKGLMGEANLRYARGDREIAKKMCFEVIRQSPDAYEPYLTLSQMYENTNLRKCKGFLMLASHLASSNVSIWCRLAEVFQQEGNIMEAVRCYSKAIKYEPKNIWLHKKRIELLEHKGDVKMILMCKQTLANNIPKKQYETVLNLVMEVAKEHFKQKNYARAIEALKIPLKRIPTQVTKDVINMLLELLLLNERYSECLDIFTQFCGFSFDITVTEENNIIVNSYLKPPALEVDLKIKFIVCLVKLRTENLLPDLIDSMLTEDNIEAVTDLYLDVVEALMQMGYYQDALKLLIPMVKNSTLAGIWLKYAECLVGCQMPDQAIEAYFTVMALAPSHVELLYPLAMLLLQQDKKKEALEVLSQDLTTNKLDVAVLIEQMKLLKQINDWDSYWKSVELLLSRHCIVLKNPEELQIVLTHATAKEKVTRLKKIRNFRGDYSEVEMNYESIREPGIEEEYGIYKDVLQLTIDRKEYSVLQKFAFMGLCSKRFNKFFDEIFLFAHFACIFNRDAFHGYSLIRDIILKHPHNNLCWNWFTLVIQSPDDLRHSRFLERYQYKISQDYRGLVIANFEFSTGNYVSALNYYMNEFKQTRSAFSAFMLGVAMLQMYMQRTLDKNKKKVIAETVTYLFLNYSKTRGPLMEQESCYNLGRMYHQLGIMYLAEYYYRKALKVTNELIETYPDILCLKREAAFNLHLIYKNSGNFIAARNILMVHIVI